MIKENQKILNKGIVVFDALCLVLSFFIAWYLRIHSGLIPVEGGLLSFREYLFPALLMIPIYLLIFNSQRLYDSERIRFLSKEVWSIAVSNILGILIFTGVLFLTKQIDYSRSFLIVYFLVSTILISIERVVIRVGIRKARNKGFNKKYIVFIGYSEGTRKFYDLTKENKHWGYNVLGLFEDKEVKYSDLEYLGNISEVEKFVSDNKDIEEVIITLELKEYDKLQGIIATCEKLGVRAQIIPGYFKYLPAKPYVEEIGGVPIINMRYIPLDNMVNKFVKRAFDIVVSFTAIVLLSPILLFIAIGIKLTSKGEIIFKQERVGLNRKSFMMYKFRSMRVQSAEEEKTQWTVKNDTRKTKFGSFLRKTSLDELPQFFNVLMGDMSIIGPRPERPLFVDKFKEEIPKYMVKHQVRPGITGWAQVNGWRGDTSIEKRIECDIYYIENWSFAFDIKIFILTFFKGFVNTNAY